MDGLPTALGVVLVLQTILDNLKLQLTNGTDNLATIELVDEQLGNTLVHQLVDTLLQLLRLHGVVVLDIFEQLRRERRQAAEVQLFALSERISNLKHATGIGQTYDIAWPCLVDGRLALCHKLCRTGEAQRLALTHMQVGLVSLELTRADLTEGDTRAVVGIDIGGNLKDKAGKLLLLRLHLALLSLRGLRTWGNLDEAVQQLLYTEVVQCRTKEYGSNLGRTVGLYLKLRIDTIYQFQVFAQLARVLLTNALVQLSGVELHADLLGHALLIGGKQVELLLIDIIYALELSALIDGP